MVQSKLLSGRMMQFWNENRIPLRNTGIIAGCDIFFIILLHFQPDQFYYGIQSIIHVLLALSVILLFLNGFLYTKEWQKWTSMAILFVPALLAAAVIFWALPDTLKKQNPYRKQVSEIQYKNSIIRAYITDSD